MDKKKERDIEDAKKIADIYSKLSDVDKAMGNAYLSALLDKDKSVETAQKRTAIG